MSLSDYTEGHIHENVGQNLASLDDLFIDNSEIYYDIQEIVEYQSNLGSYEGTWNDSDSSTFSWIESDTSIPADAFNTYSTDSWASAAWNSSSDFQEDPSESGGAVIGAEGSASSSSMWTRSIGIARSTSRRVLRRKRFRTR